MNIVELGIEIRKARKEKGDTLNKVAENLGMSVNTLSRLESGNLDSDLGITKVLRVLEYVGLRIETRSNIYDPFSYTMYDAFEDNKIEENMRL
jgi:transcriptional regulator with XRE-family HTH domain